MTTLERVKRMCERRQAGRVPITDSPSSSTVERLKRVRLPHISIQRPARTLIAFAVLAAAAVGTEGSVSMERLRSEFAKPGPSYRALPMAFDIQHPSECAAKLAAGGWGGALLSHPGGRDGYLIDQGGWDKFNAAVEACKKRGLDVWIYDELGYPSGRAGGQVLDGHPEYEARGLFYAYKDVAAKADRQIEWNLPQGTPFYVAACPLSLVGTIYGEPVDLTADAKDGVLRAQIKAGSWRLVAFVENRLYAGTHATLTGGPYINVMDPHAVKRFIELTHERYYAHCGGEFGKSHPELVEGTIKAFFNDEASLQGGYLTNETQPYPALSWYHGLPDIFQKRNGYDIRKALPALFNDLGADTVRCRCDFYDTISHAVADAYFKQIRKWCEAHGVASTGHLLWEESLLYHASFYGSYFPSLAELTWPGIDVLGCGRQCTQGSHTEGGPVTPKLISSAAHVYDKPRTISESFCFVTKQSTPMRELVGQVAWQWVLGINSLTVLSIWGLYDDAEFRMLNDFTGRVGSVLTKGDFVADAAVLYPIASVWADFVPTNRHVSYIGDQPKANDVDTAWREVSRELLACQRDFDYLDEDAICSGKLARYRILVLPHATVLRLATLKQIAKFIDGGGKVITYQTVPSIREDAGSYDEFADLVERLLPKITHVETLRSLEKALARCGAPDLAVTPRNRDIYYQHRRFAATNRVVPNSIQHPVQADAYFLVNNADAPFTGKFTFRATGKAQIWDPATGNITPVACKAAKGISTVEATVPGLSGVFVVFER